MASRGQGVSAAQERKHGLLHDGVMGWVFRYRMGRSQGKSLTGMAGGFRGKVPLLCGSNSGLAWEGCFRSMVPDCGVAMSMLPSRAIARPFFVDQNSS